jgi:release factor glutamine methyltransferase
VTETGDRGPVHPVVRAAITAAAARFGFSETPRLDAELLMAHALGTSREAMLLGQLNDPAPDGFAALVERRAAHEPVAYITGVRDFWTISLAVGPGVLIPRADSETLLEAAVDHFRGTSGPATILDLGTGPGTLLFAALAEWPRARGLGIDASEQALEYAARNARQLGLAQRARLERGDWLAGHDERFDLVLCNPPYVETGAPLSPEVRDWEPAAALFAGAEGLDDYRRLAPQIATALAPGGVGCIEIGAEQGPAAAALFRDAGLRVNIRRDLAGHQRCLVATS